MVTIVGLLGMISVHATFEMSSCTPSKMMKIYDLKFGMICMVKAVSYTHLTLPTILRV